MVREGLLQGRSASPRPRRQKDITKAYRKLARQHHPDTNPGDAKAEERFKEISSAYDVLGDAAKRKEYDEVRRLGPMAAGFGPGPGAGGGPQGFTLHGRWRRHQRPARRSVRPRPSRGGRGGGAGPGPQKGDDLEAALTLAVRGRRARHHDVAVPHERRGVQHLRRQWRRARAPARRRARCARAAASLDDNQGLFSLSSALPQLRRDGIRDRRPVPDLSRRRRRAPRT